MTNYYLYTGKYREVECEFGYKHKIPEKLHIGKSALGWYFTLQQYPIDFYYETPVDYKLNTLEDWIPLLQAGKIEDEYGRELSADEMIAIITNANGKSLPQEAPVSAFSGNARVGKFNCLYSTDASITRVCHEKMYQVSNYEFD